MPRHRWSLLRLFIPKHPADGSGDLTKVYPDLNPKVGVSTYVPKVYGFKVYGKSGSKYEKKDDKRELSYYTTEELKKLKSRNTHKEKKEMKGK